MSKIINTLVIVTGPQRAGKTTFMARLGLSKRLRIKYLGNQYASLGWKLPKNDDRMCSDRLVCGKTVTRWLKKFRWSGLLVCHSIRWRKYSKSGILDQIIPLISVAERTICFLIFPDYLSLINRILENRPEALCTVPFNKSLYLQCKADLEEFCIARGIKLYVITDGV